MRKSRKELKEELKYTRKQLRTFDELADAKFSRYMESLSRASGRYGVLVLEGGQAIVVLISDVKMTRESEHSLWDVTMTVLPQPPK